jgi:hypothetical protein
MVVAFLAAIVIVLWACVAPFARNREHERRPKKYAVLSTVVLVIFLLSALLLIDLNDFLFRRGVHVRYTARNFFGTLSINELNADDEKYHSYELYNGFISHGVQFAAPKRRREPTTYYGRQSGLGRTIDFYRRTIPAGQLKLGAVGLGTGTVAAYLERGDSITFYEINPLVIEIAEHGEWFTYLCDCRQRGAQCFIHLGDARLSLERELAAGLQANAEKPVTARMEGGPPFHVLILDAFTGDSVPVHLLTAEACESYLKCLTTTSTSAAKSDSRGAIAFHISNRYLDLERVVRALALQLNLHALRIELNADPDNAIEISDWMIVTQNEALTRELSRFADSPASTSPVLWTDTRSSLFEVLR